VDALRAAPLFAEVDDDDYVDLASRIRREPVRRADVLFDEGDAGTALYVVLTGKVKITRTAADGRETVLAVLGPSEVFGELSLFDGRPRTATAVAMERGEVAVLGADELDDWLAGRPGVARALLRVLAERLRQTNDAMSDLVFVDVPGRVAKALLSLAERFGELPVEGGGSRVTHGLTQEELAQLVGASRETVNKALADFASRGWLRLDGKAVVLLDRERLARRAH
jgi:CRP/FNR family transcriptional regulator